MNTETLVIADIAKKKACELWLNLEHCTHARSERTVRLERLAAFAASHPHVPPGDLPQLWALSATVAADWAEALRRWAEAWTVYPKSGS